MLEPPFSSSTIPMISLVFIIVLTFSNTKLSDAFFTTPENKFRSSVKIFSLDHVRAAKFGCGIPSVKSGDCLLFDPEEQGKLQGTGSLADRINHGPSFMLKQKQTYGYIEVNEGGLPIVTNTLPPGTKPHEAQHWLEYLDSKDSFPLNFAKPSSPKVATILARTPLIPGGGIHHVVLQLPEGMHYVEGQSLSIIPPGTDVKGKKYAPRLYSIASTRYGDALDGKTASLCVRRAEFYDKETGVVNPMKKGICSNYLCDSDPGTQVLVAGPVGKTMRLPENPNTDVIMIATGTGIAPFRGFMHRLFVEETVAKHMFSGTAWLILGVPFSSGLLYKSEFDAMLANSESERLKVDYAVSREMSNPFDGGKLYVQHVIAQNSEDFFNRLDNGANVYFCGLKSMMPPILKTLETVAKEKDIDWNKKLKKWKKNGQWHVEVY